MPKVVITDSTFASLETERGILRPLGLDLVEAQCRSQEDLIGVVSDADFIITQFAPVDASVIATMRRARVIVRYGIGVDNVDLDAARNLKIPVCNIPDYCIDEVADHALAMALACTRHVVGNADIVRQGGWGLTVPAASMKCLKSMTIGIVGFGRIGREVAARYKGFKCRICIFDPMVDKEQVRIAGYEPVTLEELLAASDLVTLHCPVNQNTRHIINADSISKMRPGAILINTSRGALVDTDALVAALNAKSIAFAALDTMETEPLPTDHSLRSMKNVILHSHVASYSQAATTNLQTQAASIVACAARGEPLVNVVNGVNGME